ncbi:NAD-dependent dehydratase [Pseudomonadaceae bacterium SI-3]|nr:NAD-dependent dehydratase [Pseudomonadaceae bacterium SI-3]
MKRKIIVTGGTGFVGGALLTRLVARGDRDVLAWIRRVDSNLPVGVVPVVPVVPSFNRIFAAGSPVENLDVVVHCAARVHVMSDTAIDPLGEFRKVNVDLTLELARGAVAAGAKRFIFLSTVKVNGESSGPGLAFKDGDTPQPMDPYAVSKLEAERELRSLAEDTGLEVVIIRVPLVYGPGVKGNFRSMMRWLSTGLPLPLGGLNNKRSLVALGNLVDLIDTCIAHPAAANQTLMVCDGEDLSISELLRRLAAALGRPARLLAIPGGWLAMAARLLGREDVHARLCGSLQVDMSKTQELLGWAPPVRVDDALGETARDYLYQSRS